MRGLRTFDLAFGVAILVGMANFAFAAIQGDRGYFAIVVSTAEEERLTGELATLAREREALERLASGLDAASLDLDALDEAARSVLGYARADERVALP